MEQIITVAMLLTRGCKDKRGVQVDHGSVDRTTFIEGTDGQVMATRGGLDPAVRSISSFSSTLSA